MTKKLTHIIISCGLTCLWAATAAAATVEDFYDGDHDEAWFISNGSEVPLPYTDGDDTYQRVYTYRILVNDALIDTHCEDSDGTEHNHYHILEDYSDWGLQDEADDYWDYIFKEGETEGEINYPERVSGSHATARTNCFCYALEEFTGQFIGVVYNQWLGPGEALAALQADADSHSKTTVQSCDVLAYGFGGTSFLQHMTGVDDVDTGANKPNVLRWKYAFSGAYTLDRTTFDTPRCTGTSTTVDEPLGGGWRWIGTGRESYMYPTNSVWREE
ncbi:MAG TPA: hypothetical protein VMX13_08960 [Sedimentisphaerales bacterium]|nr:hypothetical protein [Sedimentisphaerales bacterium]